MMKDFFISYNSKDKEWAEWIASSLESAGYTTVIQAWDFRPGENFVLEMQKATTGTRKTIAVLSQNYLDAAFTHPEWADAFRRDPQGNERTLIPVRIDNCQPTGLLATIIYADLYGLNVEDARQTLLNALADRAKPDGPTPFPGGAATDQPAPASPATQSPSVQPPTASPATTVNWETLSGPQQGEFVEALLSAHGNRSSLEQVLRFELDERLDEIAGSGNMVDVTTAVVSWAVDKGKAKALFDGARERNQGNPALKALEAKLLKMVPTAPQPKPESTTTEQPTDSENTHSSAGTTTAGERGVAIGGDVGGGGVIITGDGNTINVSSSSRPFPGSESSSATGGSALDIWREKLEFYRQQEAIISDAAQKFALKKQIEEAEAKIRALS